MAEVVPEDIDLVLMCTSTPFGAAPQLKCDRKSREDLKKKDCDNFHGEMHEGGFE
ncbi:unnamed protein product [Arabis nemorensis]|uniref:Uncharacterized protein n=1 Tax=Arabis nemorensis TaxID=586526 RepID=A0A565BXI4_9BRAS|nr:unnamed protein product [Arabis nemorensis]